MATFNTAFGSLPKPQEQYGIRRTRQDQSGGLDADRKKRAAGGLPAPQSARTFAQMQEAGEARPAPPKPLQAPQQQQPNMMQQLDGVLGGGRMNMGGVPEGGQMTGDEGTVRPPSMPPAPPPGPYVPPLPTSPKPGSPPPGGDPEQGGAGVMPPGFPYDGPNGPGPAGPAPGTSQGYTPGQKGEGYTPGTFNPTATNFQDVDGLQDLLRQMLAQPSRFDDQVFNQVRSANKANLDAEFGAQRQMLDEEMARRGISASSISAGRMGDLAGQQSRAMATMDADLLKEMAQTQAQDRALAAQAGTDLQRMMDQRIQFSQDMELRTFQIQEQARQAGFELSLQEARDLAQQSQFASDLSLREMLGMGQLDVDRTRAANEAKLANNQLFMNLAQIMSGADQKMWDELFERFGMTPPSQQDNRPEEVQNWGPPDGPGGSGMRRSEDGTFWAWTNGKWERIGQGTPK
jgi:hypothetical protein